MSSEKFGGDLYTQLSKVSDSKWLDSLYEKKVEDQKADIKKMFTFVADNDITADEKKSLEKNIESIQEKVERLEAKMAVLEEQILEKQEEIDKAAKDITDLATSAANKSEALADKQKSAVKLAVEDVFYMYKIGTIEKDEMSDEIARRVGQKLTGADEIEAILARLQGKKAQINGLISDAAKWIDQRNVLERQYGATKTTYDLLKINIGRLGEAGTNYTNSDYDTRIPVYSLDKTARVSDFFENYSVEANNTNYVEGSKRPDMNSLREKYSQYSSPATANVDSCSGSNLAVQNLNKAIDAGMLSDLMASGFSSQEITDFLASNFSGAQITKSQDGIINIPFGHDDFARDTYGKLTDFYKKFNEGTASSSANTWDKAGNTISSNVQIKALADNYETILSEFEKEPKFTFKEAMYALFDPEKGLFKDSGVNYDLSKQNQNPNYSINKAGDSETAQMYKKLSDRIFDIWGVKVDGEQAQFSEYDKPYTPPQVRNTDPISFTKDNTEFSFIVDKDNDGLFSGSNEFVGGSEDSSWLDDLKSLDKNSDGKLSGEELDNLKVLQSKYTDNAETTQKDGYLREETTNINYTMSSASSLGIEEIDLTGLENNVNKATGEKDINGSDIFEDSFSFKMNGEEVTAKRKDDTNLFMNTVYADAYGKALSSSIEEKDIESVIKKDYGEFDEFDAKYNKKFQNLNVIANIDSVIDQSNAMYDKAKNDAIATRNIELRRANNKVAALSSEQTEWRDIKDEVQEIAFQEGIAIDMEQAEGIYVQDASLTTAQDVVNAYKEQVAQEKQLEQNKQNQKLAWSVVIECTKRGVDVSADEIMDTIEKNPNKTAGAIADMLEKEHPSAGVNLEEYNLGYDSTREDEIYNEFNNAFNAAGLGNRVVDALAKLCKHQQQDPNYMKNATGAQLAQRLLREYT